MTSLAVAAFLAVAPGGPLVFGVPGHWVVLSRSGVVLDRVSKIDRFTPSDLGVSPDGSLYVFTAFDAEANNRLLYSAPPGGNATLLGEARGFHAAPSFSANGKWITFAHHPHKGGPVGEHEPGAMARLYRVAPNGTLLEMVNDRAGCHMASTSLDGESIYVGHADCHGHQVISNLSRSLVGPVERTMTSTSDRSGEPDLSRDGKRLLYDRVVGDTVEFREADLRTRSDRLLARFPRDGDVFRPAYSSDEKSVFLQLGMVVFRFAIEQTGSGAQLHRVLDVQDEGVR